MHRGVALFVAWSAVLLFTAAACGGSDEALPGDGDAGATTGSSDGGATTDPAQASGDGGNGAGDAGVGDRGDDGGPGDAGSDADEPIVTTTYASSLSAGRDQACVITTAGALKCWGGQEPPAQVGAGSSWKQVSVGGQAATGAQNQAAGCAIQSDDTLWCWTDAATPPAQPDSGTFKQVGVAQANRCAVATTGALYCWGPNNVFGPLGTGDTSPRATLAQVGSDLDWKHVAPGGNHTCALKTSGALHCWGWNGFGQIGDGTQDQRNAPVPVDAANTYVDVDTRSVATCAVRSDGKLLCWGSGLTQALVATPTAVDSATNWAKVRVGTGHACALKTDGSLYCWGSNDRGQLALPVATGSLSRLTPQRVGADADWTDVAVGDGFTCAIKKDDTVRCWGSNGNGQLARSPYGHPTPARIGAAGEFAHVTAGPNNVCAVRKNGSLVCWGAAGGTATAGVASQTPVAIGNATDWKTVRQGYMGACAAKTNDALHCWATGASPSPTSLTASAYDVGYFHQCAIASGGLYCWGDGIFGKLGNGSNTPLAAPTRVGVDTWKAVATSFDTTCGIKADGALFCFGFGITGIKQVGTATTWTAVEQTAQGQGFYGLQGGTLYHWSFVATPTLSGPETDWTSIAAGAAHLCGIRSGGTLWCKGDNAYGQLGDGTRVARTDVVQVGAASDWVSVSAGTSHTCGLRGGGDLYCWGSNDYGEMGDGTSFRSTPVVVP